MDPRRHLTESTLVLVEVVGAEQEGEAGIQGGADVGLRTTPVSPVGCRERIRGGRCAHVVTSLCCDTLCRVPDRSVSRTQITTETLYAAADTRDEIPRSHVPTDTSGRSPWLRPEFGRALTSCTTTDTPPSIPATFRRELSHPAPLSRRPAAA